MCWQPTLKWEPISFIWSSRTSFMVLIIKIHMHTWLHLFASITLWRSTKWWWIYSCEPFYFLTRRKGWTLVWIYPTKLVLGWALWQIYEHVISLIKDQSEENYNFNIHPDNIWATVWGMGEIQQFIEAMSSQWSGRCKKTQFFPSKIETLSQAHVRYFS